MERKVNLFEKKVFRTHSGEIRRFKIECDVLTDDDIKTLAYIISKKFSFSEVIGIPRGGIRIAKSLEKFKSKYGAFLIVDDVLTTGNSMEEVRKQVITDKYIIGVVLFARVKPAPWIYPIFQLWE